MPATLETAVTIEHQGEAKSNDVRRRLDAVEPRCIRTFTPSMAVLAKSAGSYHWTPEGRKLADFSSGVLAGCPVNLAVLPVNGVAFRSTMNPVPKNVAVRSPAIVVA